jgi:hypothetical protein
MQTVLPKYYFLEKDLIWRFVYVSLLYIGRLFVKFNENKTFGYEFKALNVSPINQR